MKQNKIDDVTKMILDSVDVNPGDKVEVSVEQDEDNSYQHNLKVVVNKKPELLSIIYRTIEDFKADYEAYKNYYTQKGALIA